MTQLMIIQQSTGDVNDPAPWPVTFAPDGEVIHGRSDASFLIGFTPEVEHPVTVFLDEAFAGIDIVGLLPVFVDASENMFTVTQPVSMYRFLALDPEAIARLRQ